MKKSRQDGSFSESVTVNGRSLAQLRQFSALLGRLPRGCSTTLGSHTQTGTGPDNRTLTFASYAGRALLGVLQQPSPLCGICSGPANSNGFARPSRRRVPLRQPGLQ